MREAQGGQCRHRPMNGWQYQMTLPNWRRIAAPLALALLVSLPACKSGSPGPGTGGTDLSQPIALRAGGGQGTASSALTPVNEAKARRAIENYRINKNRKKGPYQMTGADLDGDGVGEVMVLFSGEDWCNKAGCSLAILKSSERGYEPVFRTVRVKPPVIVARSASEGWRDIIVTSGGGAPLRRVVLRFSGNGYPRNAMREPEVPRDAPIDGEIAIAGGQGSGNALQ